MKICPFIKECQKIVSKDKFNRHCCVRFGLVINYETCSHYNHLALEKRKKKNRRPEDWLAMITEGMYPTPEGKEPPTPQ